MDGYKAVELNSEDQQKGERSLWAQCQAVADMKFTYVVSCQLYGIHKRSGDARALDTLRLMTTYVSTKNSIFLNCCLSKVLIDMIVHVAGIHHFVWHTLMRLSNPAKIDQLQETTPNFIIQLW